ncbi:MAG TPA: magnesium transporter [Myxococcota bacterium]|jgi:magnesium transporter|nr:magnesium transporter [Myxococcota bacterium]
MATDRAQVLLPYIRRLVRRNATAALTKITSRSHPADLAAVCRTLGGGERRALFEACANDERRAEILAYADLPIAVEILTGMGSVERVKAVLRKMARDDEADIIAQLPEELQQEVLAALQPSEQDQVEQLLGYPDDTAGGIMSPTPFALEKMTTAQVAIEKVRSAGDIEAGYYVYVVNEHGTLVGVISLRQLLLVPPERRLTEFMNTDVMSVRVTADQEDVALIVAKYALLAVPVVDDANKLLGVVTVDDVIHVIREEATEDILKRAGVTGGTELEEPVAPARAWRARMPWLLATMLGGVVGSVLIGQMEGRVRALGAVVAFLPVVLGMAGNVGAQSAALTVRWLALGHVEPGRFARTVLREVVVGAMLGGLYGFLLGGAAWVWGMAKGPAAATALYLGSTVGMSAAAGMTLAAALGSGLPLLFARLRIDPAAAAGPFVGACSDVLGIITYFAVAILMPLGPAAPAL